MKVDPANLVQLEFQVSDLETASAFYEKVMGWTAVPAEMHDMLVMDVGSDCPYGISLRRKKNADIKHGLIPYFSHEDPEEIFEQVSLYGGKKKSGPIALPSYGSVWFIADPDGQTIGLFKDID